MYEIDLINCPFGIGQPYEDLQRARFASVHEALAALRAAPRVPCDPPEDTPIWRETCPLGIEPVAPGEWKVGPTVHLTHDQLSGLGLEDDMPWAYIREVEPVAVVEPVAAA